MKKLFGGARTNLSTTVMVIVILAVMIPDSTHGRPSEFISSRQKRVSDQRVAELETLLALAKMRGKLVTVPVGFGRVDPARIGRKRRSSRDNNFEKLRRLLQVIIQYSAAKRSEDNDDGLPFFSTDLEDGTGLGTADQII